MKKLWHLWNLLLHTGTQTLQINDPQRRITIGVNLMTMSIGLLNVTIGTFVLMVAGKFSVLAGDVIETFLLAGPLLLNFYKRYSLASLSVYLIMAGASLYFGSLLGKSIESQFMITYLIGVALFMFSRFGYRLLAVAIAIFVLIFIERNLNYHYIKPLELDPSTGIILRWSAYTAMVILVIITFHIFQRNSQAMRSEIQENSRQIELLLKKEAEENKSKDNFIGKASHEMKVSFKSIFAIINILYEEENRFGLKSKRLNRTINDLRTACKISQTINDNIFEYEKFKAGHITNNRQILFDVPALFTNTVEILRYLAEEQRISILLHISEDTPGYMLSDDVKIRQILTNLLHNAIKFAPDESAVTVSVRVKNDQLVFSVQDQGPGISAHDGDIFAPFVTKNPDGLGLGLFIVKESVHALDGKISLKSSPGSTRFSIYIPLQPIQQPSQAHAHTHSASQEGVYINAVSGNLPALVR